SALARSTTRRCIGSSAQSRRERTAARRASAKVRRRRRGAMVRLYSLIRGLLLPDVAQGEPRFLIKAARYGYGLIRDYLRVDLSLRAMSLVYTTIIAVVPLLALSFAMAVGFNLHLSMRDLLEQVLAPVENVQDVVDEI